MNFEIQTGKYYLGTHQLSKAKEKFESALKINPSAPVEKEIAEVYLQLNEPAKATSILQSYINRNFYDKEAHNQLLYSYYMSNRWDLGLDQAWHAHVIWRSETIFLNNLVVFDLLKNDPPEYDWLWDDKSAFINYNIHKVFKENDPEFWYRDQKPFLKSKLLFQEFKFNDIDKSKNEVEVTIGPKKEICSNRIVSFGREGYSQNIFSVFPGSRVSRSHFLIVNMKDNVWLYDLGSTGVRVDGQKVHEKCFLLGYHDIEFGGHKIGVKTDTKILL